MVNQAPLLSASQAVSLGADARSYLMCRSGRSLGALPLEQVVETMRPLPVESVPDMPPYLLGLAMIRGQATPVLHLGRLLGQGRDIPSGRFVRLQCGTYRYALAVDEVLGLRSLAVDEQLTLPPLLKACRGHGVDGIGALDQALLLMLQSACLLPQELAQRLESQESAA